MMESSPGNQDIIKILNANPKMNPHFENPWLQQN